MFFHTHVYYAKKVSLRLDGLTIIGSILPDFAFSSIINWNDLHKKKDIDAFSSYLKKNKPEYNPLLIGIQHHNVVDYLSHIKYKNTIGYAYNNVTPELVDLVTQAFSIDTKLARVTSHNFIETGVEVYTLRGNKELSHVLKGAIESINTQDLAQLLASFYKKPQKDVHNSLEMFFSLATKYNLENSNDWVMLWEDIGQLLFDKKSNKKKVKEALELSLAITKDTYKEYLATAVAIKDTKIEDCN